MARYDPLPMHGPENFYASVIEEERRDPLEKCTVTARSRASAN